MMEKKQASLFTDAVGWQKCECNPEHGEYNPHAYYELYDLEQMMLDDGYISCPFCLVEIAGVFSP